MADDATLKSNVLAELAWDPAVTQAHIGVTARDGIVTLTGHVTRFTEKHAAQMAAFRVEGVKAVAEEIEVKLPFDTKRSDEDIARAAIERLAWDTAVPADSVPVTVRNGWVTLAGTVRWHFQHDAAANDVRNLWGVVGISNQILLTPTANSGTIERDIAAALHRSWMEPASIAVSTNGGTIRLTGQVKNWAERELAGATAWAAEGATDVENFLTVG